MQNETEVRGRARGVPNASGRSVSHWRELPAELHPDVRHLIVRLRRLKDRSELSKRGLAAKTGYSAKSWQRYLNGRSLPPREAVESMAHVGGDNPHRLLVLHEIAAQRWSEGRAVTTPAAAPAPDDGPAPPEHAPTEHQRQGRHLRVAVTAAAVVTALSVTAALLLAVRLTEARAQLADERAGVAATAVATVSESMVPVIYTCELEQRDGRWYAGLSRTTDILLSNTQMGLEVAEAQCLLQRAGSEPGDIDGVFGPKTRRAVERMQKRGGLIVNGVIDPPTWQALREGAPQ
ncbi:peptidoglycan-binding protein [Streptomyces olivaceus]|uniref:Peptidoglycan-binding protein n=1 Tax=Streptomyces olivaceus TaxID=47716 RepID=A0ABS7W121_STROV|nr:peptidoglycan-binding protein [Streptomyces olivaceus]QIP71602.1 peptidoglycan-binding protein [Streptomyces sp. VN1]MBZ6088776.1 peptidoglycan-binding protein [Streptomyces olivaceus]MBZ6095850.1 peptidoglycan-binding protein [Streptomyces olivaceus]MBZ6111563.1 peptidoglycan-binding protein [Streptomyces olivaceus]